MKENKFLNNNEQIIEDFTTRTKVNIKVSHPLVVEETEQRFVVVDHFSDDAKSAPKNSNIYQSDLEVKEEVELVYAEEILDDDGDDLYEEALHDIAIEKQRHRTYFDIGKGLDEALSNNGVNGEFGFSLLTSMKYSRLLYLQNNEHLEESIRVLCGTCGVPFFKILASECSNIADGNTIFDVLSYAKKSFNKPIFIYVGVINYTDVLKFFEPVYSYIDNPDGDAFITANGRSLKVPSNIYFIYTLQDDNRFFDVSRRLLRYSARVTCELSRSKADLQIEKTFPLSTEELVASFRETCEGFAIEEESWRKIDNLFQSINSVNGYIMKNKIQRRFEDILLILISGGKKVDDAIDIALASYVLHEAIITHKPIRYFEDVNLIELIEDSFGTGTMKLSKAVVKKYLALFNKKGERVNG